jgi:hypothetical protein
MATKTYHEYTNTHPLPLGQAIRRVLSSQVRAETAEGTWMFEHKGQHQTITILRLEAHTELASVKRGMQVSVCSLFYDYIGCLLGR